MNENLLKAIDLATIANWIMIIGVAFLVYINWKMSHRKSSSKTAKK